MNLLISALQSWHYKFNDGPQRPLFNKFVQRQIRTPSIADGRSLSSPSTGAKAKYVQFCFGSGQTVKGWHPTV